MKRLTWPLVAAAVISTGGCASMPPQPIVINGVVPESASETFRACEEVVYRSAEADSETALRCGHYLDIWR